MPVAIDYQQARDLLNRAFASAQQRFLSESLPSLDPSVAEACREVFASSTQAYREVLLGCLMAKMLNPTTDIRKPYVNQGSGAFNGRTLDEQVVNRFLKRERIPSSAGPYLSMFRRSVQFVPATRDGLRGKAGYDALLRALAYAESAVAQDLYDLLVYLLFGFVQLREAAIVPLARPGRISLAQYDALIAGLLAAQSGGRFPLLLTVATFMAIKDVWSLDWQIEHQGINVADVASGAGGDITVRSQERVILAVEVTERTVDKSRVVTTFQAKILPAGIEDYLFVVKLDAVPEEARRQAQRYFAQGHEVNFVEIKDWILMVLATIGSQGRERFTRLLVDLLGASEIPSHMKVAWNRQIEQLTAPG